MADDVKYARHAFGSEAKIEEALSIGKIDAYDILFLDEKKVGWVDRDGNVVIAEPDLSGIESELATKADSNEVAELESKLTFKADAEIVNSKIGEIESTLNDVAKAAYAHEQIKYDFTGVPDGTLVDISENEIRIMCSTDAAWTKQSVGTGGDPNTYYGALRTYVYNDNIVGYKEHLGSISDPEILYDLKIDSYGRRYQPTWLGLAKYDEATDTWTYYGANSTSDKMVGWDYRIEWFDVNGVMVAADSVRINLSNENCHFINEPYYIGQLKKEVEEKISNITNGVIEIVEF